MDQVALYKALADAAELGHTTTVKTLLVKDLHSMWRLVLAFLVFTIPRLAELGDSGIGPGKLFVRAELASAAAPPPAAAPAALAGAGPRPHEPPGGRSAPFACSGCCRHKGCTGSVCNSSRIVSRNLLSEHYDSSSMPAHTLVLVRLLTRSWMPLRLWWLLPAASWSGTIM